MFRPLISAIVASSALGSASPVHAQEPADPDRWSTEVGFSLNTTGGNQSLTVLTTRLGLSHLETRRYEANFGTELRYGRSEGQDVARNLRANLNVDLWPEAGWSPFLFATAENDPFKKLEARLNGGAGVKRTFWQRDWNEVSASGAVLYSYESLDLADSLGTGVTETARLSWRGRGRLEFGEGRRFEQLVFYQPAWDDLDDYLLEVVTSSRLALTRALAFTTTFRYDRDSTPAPDVLPDDWSLSVGLSLATRW